MPDPAGRLLTPTFALLTAVGLAVFVAFAVTIPVLPRFIEGPLDGGSVAVGIGIGVISVSSILGRPFFGRVGDRSGRRLLILAGATVTGLATLAHVLVDSFAALLALRLCIGAGQGAFFVGAATLVNDLAPPHRRGEAHSYFSVAIYLGLGLGPVLGETLLGDGAYDRVWVAGAVLAALGLVLATRLPRARSSVVGDGRRRLVHPAGVGPGAVVGLGVMGFVAYSAFLPLYVDELGLAGAGTAYGLYAVVVLLLRVVGARLPDRAGPARVGRAAVVSCAAGLLLIGGLAGSTGLYAGTAVLGVGMALLYPAMMTLASSRAPEGEQASVVATFTGFFDLAQGAGGAVLGGVAAVTGYRGAFLVGGLVAMSGLLPLARLTSAGGTRLAVAEGGR